MSSNRNNQRRPPCATGPEGQASRLHLAADDRRPRHVTPPTAKMSVKFHSPLSPTTVGGGHGAGTGGIVMCRQWWRVCWIYGDQEKYYRQLYGAAKRHHHHDGKQHIKQEALAAVTTTTASAKQLDAYTTTTTTTTTTASLFAASLDRPPRLHLQGHEMQQLRQLHHLQSRVQPE